MILCNLNNGINTSPIYLRPWVQVRQVEPSFLTYYEAFLTGILSENIMSVFTGKLRKSFSQVNTYLTVPEKRLSFCGS